jgi:hypothetical protein
MSNALQSKLGRKVVFLFTLIAALAYLRKPDQVQAQNTCVQGCVTLYIQCINKCDGNQTCENRCGAVEETCIRNCGL